MEAARENKALTGLRGAAAGLVLLHHLSLHGPGLGAADRLVRHGYLAVDLFFVLSGFVIAAAYGPWFRGGPQPGAVTRFLWRRFARLWPLHAAILGGLVLWRWLEDGTSVSLKFGIANLLLVQAWGISGSYNPPSWSASTELAAYLLFPLLAAPALAGGGRRRRSAAVALAGAGLVALAACLGAGSEGRRGPLDLYDNNSVLPLLRCLGGFLVGVALWRAAPLLRRMLAWPGTAPLALAGALLAVAGVVPDWLAYPCLPLLVGALWAGGGVARAIARPGPHALGRWSYALYLVHMPLIAAWAADGRRGAAPVAVAALAAVSVGLAAALHRVLEVPARRGLRRLEWDRRGKREPVLP